MEAGFPLSPPSRGSVSNGRPKAPTEVIDTVQVSLRKELTCGESMLEVRLEGASQDVAGSGGLPETPPYEAFKEDQ